MTNPGGQPPFLNIEARFLTLCFKRAKQDTNTLNSDCITAQAEALLYMAHQVRTQGTHRLEASGTQILFDGYGKDCGTFTITERPLDVKPEGLGDFVAQFRFNQELLSELKEMETDILDKGLRDLAASILQGDYPKKNVQAILKRPITDYSSEKKAVIEGAGQRSLKDDCISALLEHFQVSPENARALFERHSIEPSPEIVDGKSLRSAAEQLGVEASVFLAALLDEVDIDEIRECIQVQDQRLIQGLDSAQENDSHLHPAL